MKDFIMKLLGYMNIDKIKIPEGYRRPKENTIETKKKIYKEYGVLPEILVNEKNVLINSFCSYYLAKVWNMQYVRARKVYNQREYKNLYKKY